MIFSLALPYSSPPLSLNRRQHYQKEASDRRQVKSDVGWLARYEKLPKNVDRVHVTLLWHPKIVRRRDSDNPSPTLKPAIDALVQYGLVGDDTAAHVSSNVIIVPPHDPGRHGMWLVVLTEGETPEDAAQEVLHHGA